VAQTSSQSLPNSGGTTFRTNLNTILAALFSENSGATEPTVTVAGMVWFDTTTAPGVLKVRNSTDTGWIAINATDFATLAEALAGTLTTKAINPDVLKKILDGAASAPRIVGSAHKRLADMPVLTVTASAAVNAENLCTLTAGTLGNNSNSTMVIGATYVVNLATGTMRFSIQARGTTDGTDNVFLQIFKNGVAQSTVANSGATALTTFTFDMAVVPGDVVTWRYRKNSINGGPGVAVANPSVTANDGYVERPAYVTFLNRDTP
jgi:hypothetical protein